MSHMVDDDPPIRTHAASKEYRDNWDRIFGEQQEPADKSDPDAYEGRVRLWMWWCNVCKAHVTDPQNHAVHGVIQVEATEHDGLCPCPTPEDE